MTVATESKPITIEDFMARPDAQEFELIDGNLVGRKEMGAESAWIAPKISASLIAYVEEPRLGWTFGSDAVYRCFASPSTGRRPDVSFIRCGRLAGERVPKGYISIAPDLAIEVVSPNDLAYEVAEKVAEYLDAGVRLVWIVFPNTRSVEVRYPNGSGTVVHAGEEITAGDVIPGYTARIEQWFLPHENVSPMT